jgi:hypothetical protein
MNGETPPLVWMGLALLFWPALAAGQMVAPFGRTLARRDFGLTSAAAHLVQVGLAVWLYRISSKPPLSDPLFAFFAMGLVCIYTLTILSSEGCRKRLARDGGEGCGFSR